MAREKAVIKKALVNLKGPHFKLYEKKKDEWRLDDEYNAPGPIQYFANSKITEMRKFFA